MERRTGFCNIFNNEKYQRNEESKNIKHLLEDWEISDCEEEDENSVNIVNNSSNDEEELQNKSLNIATFNQTPLQATKAAKRSIKQQYSKSARKKALPHIAVKRKSHQEVTPKRRALSILNSPEKIKSKPSATTSPWNKTQHVFAPVQKSASAEFLPKTTKPNDRLSWCCSQPIQDIDDAIIESSTSSARSLWSSSSTSQIIESNTQSISYSHIRSQTIETPITTSQTSTQSATELDRLIALIEQEGTIQQPPQTKSNRKGKRISKNGYLLELKRTLKSSKTDRKYLEHDKKFGLESGTKLRVLKLEVSFGVNLAIVEVDGGVRNFGVVLDADMAKKVQVGSELEAFFSAEIAPYIVNGKDNIPLDVFVQPNKLLIL